MSNKSRMNAEIKSKLVEILGDNLRCFGHHDDKPCTNTDYTVSHMFKSNTASTIRRTSGKVFDYSDYQNTIPLCNRCHAEYEKLPATRQDTILSKNVELTRLEWLENALGVYGDCKTGHIIFRHILRFNWFIGSRKRENKTYD